MKEICRFLFLLLAALPARAQLQGGRENIDKLCGCFDVEFKYAETFAPDPNYKFHPREQMGARELALPIEASARRVVIQHLLILDDTTVIKHWREDWEFEQPYLWKYEGAKKWVRQQLLPAAYKGRWTQTVWEVDDAPRYQGISEWVATDGKVFWQSTVAAPLPRREYTVRNDYDILRRGNRLVLTDSGWTHEQDNDKIRRQSGGDHVIAQEKGYNIYTRANKEKCAYALQWWQQHSAFWGLVRTEWQQLLTGGNRVSLQAKVDNKVLHQHLDELSDQYNNRLLSAEAAAQKIKTLLQKFAQVNAEVAGK
ncbi:DUF6607 family protein [Paraflavisolibacter sp. H34]|uniref:DUF6607 family protein n=1 Tax=Huijunlia imazamoxiresistens TaxID=3127457 RepID=UPI003019F8FD